MEAHKGERTPVRSLVQCELARVRNNVSALFTLLSEATGYKRDSVPRTSIDAAFQEVLRSSGRLRAATQVLHEHQAFQAKIVSAQNAIDQADQEILKLSQVLGDAQEKVEKQLFERAIPLLGKATGSNKPKPVDTAPVLELAKMLSYCTAAPPGWHPTCGQQLTFPYSPPTPQQERVRDGRLFTPIDKALVRISNLDDQEQDEERKNEQDDGNQDEEETEPKLKRRKTQHQDGEDANTDAPEIKSDDEETHEQDQDESEDDNLFDI